MPPRPVDSNVNTSNLNPPRVDPQVGGADSHIPSHGRVEGAKQAAERLGVDSTLIDKALQKYGAAGLTEMMKELGAACESYFRHCAGNLRNLCERYEETQVKTLPATCQDIHQIDKKTWFDERGVKGVALEVGGPLPQEMFSNPRVLKQMVEKGWFTAEQAQAIQYFFMNPDDGRNRQAQLQSSPSQERGYQEGRGDQQGNQENPDEPEFYLVEETSSEDGQITRNEYRTGNYAITDGRSDSSTPSSGQSSSGGSVSSGIRGMNTRNLNGPPSGSRPTPPPAGRTAAPGQTPSNPSGPLGVDMAEEFVRRNFDPNDPRIDGLKMLFQSQTWYRNISGNLLGKLYDLRQAKKDIMAQLAGIDASTPEGAKRLYVLQQQIGELQTDERQIYDMISQAQKANAERVELLKKLGEIASEAKKAVIANMK